MSKIAKLFGKSLKSKIRPFYGNIKCEQVEVANAMDHRIVIILRMFCISFECKQWVIRSQDTYRAMLCDEYKVQRLDDDWHLMMV